MQEVVVVTAPVIHPAVSHGEEVAARPSTRLPVEVDHHAADVMANPRRSRLGGEVSARDADEGADRITPPVRWFALHLQDAVGHEQLDELVEAATVDAMGVAGDRVPDLLACHELPELHGLSPLSPSQVRALQRRMAKPPTLQPRALASVTRGSGGFADGCRRAGACDGEQRSKMRVGVSLRTAFVVDDVRIGARWVIERAAAARAAGLDCLLVGDHHATPVPYYQNTPLLGRLLAEWGGRPFGALFLLPLWNPVLVAEHVGTLAALGAGRFILPLAVGGRDQYPPMGVHVRHRGEHFEAELDIVRQLLAGQSVSVDAPYRLKDARVSPVPPDPVEVWIGGTAEPAIDRAARLGDGFLANADLTPEQARTVVARYRERCEAHGRTPTAVAIRRDIHVGADPADAERVAGPIVAGGYRGFDPSACTYGSPEQVTERLGEYAAMGYTDVIVRHLAEDQAEVLESYERLAAVRQALLAA
jgi:alkanesulfonate monooxygenase SsuD/methylene tetrahydromethanopterin reductase-like flavin-dependent oxidoreductase (luciferase family)